MCGLPVTVREFVVYQDPTGCLTAFRFSPFEVRDDSNPSGDGLSHLNRIKIRRGCHTMSPYCSPSTASSKTATGTTFSPKSDAPPPLILAAGYLRCSPA